jgi:hypothetical protein
MKRIHLLGLLLSMCSLNSLQAQTFASSQQAAENIQVSISTQVQDDWTFSGNIILGKTRLSGLGDEPEIVFHELETLDEDLLQELDKLVSPKVALANFSASVAEQKVQIDWASLLSDAQIKSFFVQRSLNGQSWEDIGMFTTKDRTEVMAPYSFVDNHPVKGSNFYRLRQVSQNEESHFSEVIAVEVLEKAYHVTHIYPNPIIFGADIDFELFEPATLDIRLYDEQGTAIGTIYSDLTSIGHHAIEINLDKLPRGTYLCRIKVGDAVCERVLVK